MWISFNKICRNKMSEAIFQPKKLNKQRSKDLDKEEKHENEVQIESKFVESFISYKQNAPLCSFKEMGIGDPSTKVIEKILRDTLTNPREKTSKISKVFRVKNSPEVVEKFEKYRDMVKLKAKETEHKHPRSLVDGNELLCFYATSMTCYSRKFEQVSGTCEQLNCNLCQIISSSFDMKYSKKFGIQLSMSGEALHESISAVWKVKNSKRVVILCRIIAGRIRATKDGINEDVYDSIRSYRRFSLNSEHLIVKNPNAVLPCFVIVLN
ncbi:Thioredoxin reductase 2 mitochondrial [Bienertia sinuspersici]